MKEFLVTFSRRRWESTDMRSTANDLGAISDRARTFVENGTIEDGEWDFGAAEERVEVTISDSSGSTLATFTVADAAPCVDAPSLAEAERHLSGFFWTGSSNDDDHGNVAAALDIIRRITKRT